MRITIDTDNAQEAELAALFEELPFEPVLAALSAAVKTALDEALQLAPEYQRLHALVLAAQSYADRHGI